jgi:hypothetical protein
MAALTWDQTGTRFYETGVDHGVLYLPNPVGVYDTGYAWNGLITVTESPSGAEASPQYADNIKYLNLISAEEFGATIEAFTYPEEFSECDGTAVPERGVVIGQQPRKQFGLCYRTKVGNDVAGQDLGYKLHLIYGAQAAPSEKAYSTVNDSPEALTFSWELTTTPVDVPGYSPTASMTIDSTKVDSTALASLETMLYGSGNSNPTLPTPEEVLGLFGGTVTQVIPTAPTYVEGTKTLTIPSIVGVEYYMDGAVVAAGDVVLTKSTMVYAKPTPGHRFPLIVDTDWFYRVA